MINGAYPAGKVANRVKRAGILGIVNIMGRAGTLYYRIFGQLVDFLFRVSQFRQDLVIVLSQ